MTWCNNRRWRVTTRCVDDAIDEDSRRYDRLGWKLAQFGEMLRLHDSQFGGHRHDWIEIATAPSIDEISPAIRAPSLDECNVACQPQFHQIIAAGKCAGFLAFRHL